VEDPDDDPVVVDDPVDPEPVLDEPVLDEPVLARLPFEQVNLVES